MHWDVISLLRLWSTNCDYPGLRTHAWLYWKSDWLLLSVRHGRRNEHLRRVQ